ncbi:MAG: DUF692 family multinuclear iron-containing protein [Pseudomonadota bacterium]
MRPAVPPRAGLAWRPSVAALSDDAIPRVAWFNLGLEAIDRPAMLEGLGDRTPLCVEARGLSIGQAAPPDPADLRRLAALARRCAPGLVSLTSDRGGMEHFDRVTPPSVTRIATEIDAVQCTLGRPILFGGPGFGREVEDETGRLAELALRSGCGLLLDVTDLVLRAAHHCVEAEAYLESYPLHLVGKIHLTAHPRHRKGGMRPCFEAHAAEIVRESWDIYRAVIARTGPLPTLIDCDAEIPDWARLGAEAARADAILDTVAEFRRAS